MKRLGAAAVMLFVCELGSMDLKAASPEVERAKQYGAEGQVTLRVVDSKGIPVEGAKVNAGFYNPHKRGQVAEGQTDTNGFFVAAGTPVEDMHYMITNGGFYKTEGTYVFYHRGIESPVKDGRWQPWNSMNTVVLKESRNPVPMYGKNVDTPVPIRDAPIGFDLEVGDWVAPHGKGKESDLFFAYSAKVQDCWNFSNQLVVACSNKMNGLYRTAKDMASDFRSTYEANASGYQPQVVLSFATTKERTLQDQRLGGSEYLVFRVRTVIDDKGNIVSARYGKIYGPIEYGEVEKGRGGVHFTYYFNPTANDRNLEFDPSRNLFGWRHDAPEYVYMP